MTISFILMLISGSALPLLALLALLLRRNLFTGKLKVFFLSLGLLLLSYSVFDTVQEQQGNLGFSDIVVGVVTALITLFILSRFSHGHSHDVKEGGIHGIVISEAFHSLIDGAVIGATYLISPLLGYAATVGIIVHELPKIIGTIAVLRSFNLSIKKTILYGMAAQIGSPVSAVLIFVLGKKINDNQFHALEIASISSLAAIVLWIMYLEIRFHVKHDHSHHNH